MNNTGATPTPDNQLPELPYDYTFVSLNQVKCPTCGDTYSLRYSITPDQIILPERTRCQCSPTKEQVEAELLEEARKNIRAYFDNVNLINHNIPPLSEVRPKPGQVQTIDEIYNYLADQSGKGIRLEGPPGRGKTYLMIAAAKELSKTRNVLAIKSIDLLSRVRRAMWDTEDRKADLIYLLRTVDVLVIDDIGVEKVTDYVLNTLYSIIDYRFDKGYQTFYTTNLTGAKMAEKLDTPLTSRICGTKAILVTGKDWRIQPA